MNSEINKFVKIWMTAISCICYCYYISARFPKGILRLLTIFPIIYLFIILPFSLSSVHLGGPTVFYLVWLSSFKLILFSFDNGPLSTTPPLSLLHFTCVALLPIKSKHPLNKTTTSFSSTSQLKKSTLVAVKVLLLVMIIYAYKQDLHPHVILCLYCCHVYLGTELVLAITGFPVGAILGLEIEPQFNEPYLATSLQDFWGRRWNLMVTSILRPTIYNPVLNLSTRCGLGPLWIRAPPTFATFLVSGLMHELIFYYLTRVGPTWEVTWFFVLHGVSTAAEVVVKKAADGKYRLHRAASGIMTVGFVAVTGVWLFFPQLIRNGVDQRAIEEYAILADFARDKFMFFTT
ncbi:putative long-chain-alcohol O-fatty-acyltransferase 5 [Heracleum sosnowskyi]|uniref:Long-chain-alcohol O-fatty-acyltransferase 5 n=1 Tax=Heracleum sosnowskyi TaxID=360622 RepID=A0AAD8J3S0_9APIA|nr:putative long-chain-alcohol O-fatty-acyltransferase 5 [Heracleum sosnowskyi]